MCIKILEYGGKLNSFLFSRSKDRFKTVLLRVYGLYGPLRALRARPTGPYGLRALRAHGPYGPPTGLPALRAVRALTRTWTMTERDLVLLLAPDPRHGVDMTHHSLLSPDSSQSPPCDQAITPSWSLAAQMELLGKAGLRVNCCKSRANTQKKWFGRVNGSKSEQTHRRSNLEKQNSTANIMNWTDPNWWDWEDCLSLPLLYTGASVLVFLLLWGPVRNPVLWRFENFLYF